MDKLLNCPFCGGANIQISPYDGNATVICMDCCARSMAFAEKQQAISAWNTRAEEPNEPLTLDELKQMDIFEWVWIEIKDNESAIESAYFRKSGDLSRGKAFCCGYPGTGYYFEYVDYGKAWLAYKHKPKEAD